MRSELTSERQRFSATNRSPSPADGYCDVASSRDQDVDIGSRDWIDFPVDGRKVVTSPVSVQGGALPGNVDDFRYPTAEPISLLVEDGELFLREWVSSLVKVVTPWRGAVVVLRDAFAEAPLSLTYICGITVWTLDLVHYTCPLVVGNFVLGVYQAAPDGVVRFEVHGHPCSADGSAESVGEVPYVWECDAVLLPGGAADLGDSRRFGLGGSNPGGLGIARHTWDFLEVVYLSKFGLLTQSDGVASVV